MSAPPCPKCGTATRPGALFCAGCGAEIPKVESGRTGTVIAAVPPDIAPPPPAAPSAVEGASSPPATPSPAAFSPPAAAAQAHAPAPPTAPPPPVVPTPAPQAGFGGTLRALDRSALIAIIALAINVVTAVVWIVGCQFGINAALSIRDRTDTAENLVDQANTADLVYAIGSYGWLISGIAVIVTFIVWLWRAYGRLPAFGCEPLRYGRHQVIWTWIVPILSLFRPYQLVADTARGSQPAPADEASWRQRPGMGAVGWWWAAFLIAAFATRFTLTGIDATGTTLTELADAYQLMMGGIAVMLPSAVLAIVVVYKIGKAQVARTAQLDQAR